MKRKVFLSLVFVSFLFFSFVFTQNVKAACQGSPPACNCSGSRIETEYRCSSTNCGAIIQKRTRTCTWSCSWEKTCNCTDSTWDCGNCLSDTETCGDWGSAVDITTCKSRQKCGNTTWSSTQNTCQCNKDCLATPQNPRYYDNPTYSDQPDKSKDPNNIFLPVKLDWDDVEDADSYVIRMEEIQNGSTTELFSNKVVNVSEYSPNEGVGSCFLKPNTTYNWYVKACCGADGTTNCGSESPWGFKTNTAPELISPEDPDWNGINFAENIPIPVTLDWCDIDGAQSYRLRIYLIEDGQESCHPRLKFGELCESRVITPSRIYPLVSEFQDAQVGLFARETEYKWEIAACSEKEGKNCGDFGQKWTLKTAWAPLPAFQLLLPSNDPGGENPAGPPVLLDWKDEPGINSFIYEVKQVGGGTEITEKTLGSGAIVNYPQLSFDTRYSWKVKPCSGYKGNNCDDWPKENGSIREWYFKTTGRAPKPETMKPVGTDILIPVNFEWENVPGAKSYRIKIQGVTPDDGIPVKEPKKTFDYPDLHQETDYSWQVKTCARENGETCGEWSSRKNFKMFKLPVPSNPSPKDNGNLYYDKYDKYLSWDAVTGATAYQYTIDYDSDNPPPEEKNENCPGLVGTKIIPPTINTSPSVFLNLECLGKYNWFVTACLDENCQETGDQSNWHFTFAQPAGVCKPSLVPCGRNCDVPAEITPWNEREPCQIKHLFLLLRNIIDFLLWRVGLIILVLLSIATGVIYYFSMGAPTTIVNVRAIWRSVGVGYGILFFAWIIVNLLLAILGYKVGIFGHWWEIRF